MTNTKFRRRALLSSVAMLLVALVALGSATFAWFTENPVVTASGISAKGEVSQGLEIWTTSQNSYTKNSATLMTSTAVANGKELVLSPAYANFTEASSVKTFTGWLKANAAQASASAPTGNWESGVTVIDAASTNMQLGTGVYHEQIKIKTTDGETAAIKLTNFAVTPVQNAPSIANGVTVLVVVSSVIKAMGKIGSDAILTYTSPASDSAVGTSAGTWAKTTVPAAGIELGNAGNESNALVIDVYVYLDGTDTTVYTNNVSASQLLSSVALEFKK